MIGCYEEAHNFVSYLTPEERLEVFEDLLEILHLCNHTDAKKTFWNEKMTAFVKSYTHCKQLFQCKNNRNEEIIIRKVSESNFFQQQTHIEVFFNFKETSVDFIYKITEILQQELFNQEEFAVN